MKNLVRFIILFPLSVYLIYSVYHFIKYPKFATYKDCGIIISKSSDEIAIKHGTETELLLNIEFEKTGFKSIKCEPTTYFKFNKNDSVCFDLEQEDMFFYTITNFIGFVLICLSGFVLAFMIIYFIVPDKWKE